MNLIFINTVGKYLRLPWLTNQKITAFIIILICFGYSSRLYGQGDIEVRIGTGGPEIFSGCVYFAGISAINTHQTTTFEITNAHPGENLTITGYNISGNVNTIASITPNSPPIVIPPLGTHIMTLNRELPISTTELFTITINNSDVDESNFTLQISHTAWESSFFLKRLIINELSNGPSGTKEFVELLVVGPPGACPDIRKWRFDDNSGRDDPSPCSNKQAITPGHGMFDDINFWKSLPSGSLIVLYNEADRNPNIPPDDPNDSNADSVYIFPMNSTLLKKWSNYPQNSPGQFCNDFRKVSDINVLPWSTCFALNNSGDLFQILDSTTTNINMEHSIAYGNLSNPGTDVFFAGSGSQKTVRLINSVDFDPNKQTNWEFVNASNETPGNFNSPQNAQFIKSLRYQMFSCVQSEGCRAFFSSNATLGVSAYDWDFDGNNTVDRTTNTPFTDFTYPNPSIYQAEVLVNTTPNSCGRVLKKNVDLSTCSPFNLDSFEFSATYLPPHRLCRLHWEVPAYDHTTSFLVERATQGNKFETIAKLKSSEFTNKTNNIVGYTFNDRSIHLIKSGEIQGEPKKIRYRIKSENFDGFSYSQIRSVSIINDQFCDLFIFPNPVENKINIQSKFPINSVELFNTTGQLVLQLQPFSYSSTNFEITTETLPEGFYFARIQTEDGRIYIRQLVKHNSY